MRTAHQKRISAAMRRLWRKRKKDRLVAVAIARQGMREAFYRSYSDLDVEGIIDAVEEYVTARLKAGR